MFLGSGENNQILGPGVYFGSTPGLAKMYWKYNKQPYLTTATLDTTNYYDPIKGTATLNHKFDDIAKELKARNNTFYRKGGDSTHDRATHVERTTRRTNLPKLKPIPIPENKSSDESPSCKKHTKFSHVRSSGYGPSTIAPEALNSGTCKLPSLRENHGHNSHGSTLSKKTKLPPLGRDFRWHGRRPGGTENKFWLINIVHYTLPPWRLSRYLSPFHKNRQLYTGVYAVRPNKR